MTVPACARCNVDFSLDEKRVAAVICTVSFTAADQLAVAPGGWMHQEIQADIALKSFIQTRLGQDGIFQVDQLVVEALRRVMAKTAVGLLFHEFGRAIPLNDIQLIGVEHARNIDPAAFVEINRHEGSEFAEVTPSGRQLERQVVALFGNGSPPHMPDWKAYIPGYFEYMFIRRTVGTLLTAFKIHDALTVLLESPWPSKAGPRRGARPPRKTGI